ncbi:hypothetical protein CAEBREN_23140 [Caenorhabditis brenneri]|uniref:Uncharacterized protein n=1 Tax=Caenorhabditis brenneri TaxID=135651 RepID=G0NKC9_CAEBE|nr:hypothetical protein CAEBREN_23140 [Caenorhabditis brenneri]
MELEKEKFNFVIEDLRCEFRNVADLFGCDVSENSRIHFPKNQILDDLVYKEVNFAMGLWNKKAILTRRRTVID